MIARLVPLLVAARPRFLESPARWGSAAQESKNVAVKRASSSERTIDRRFAVPGELGRDSPI